MSGISKRGSPPIRIAHAHGNRRDKIESALEAPVDLIEADLWYRDGDIWVRHDRRLPLIPLIFGRRPKNDDLGPLALPLSRWYLRPDVNPIRLEELVKMVGGRRGLLLDLKGQYNAADGRRFAERIVDISKREGVEATVRLCGQVWRLLDLAAAMAPGMKIHYTIEYVPQWQAFLRRLGEGDRINRICLHRRLLDEERARLLQERGIEVFCWDVDDKPEAERLLALGVDGIISDDLSLLADLPSR
ncbi:MAG: glycerophosphodiester phosphodiesterase [Dehalococcoidia bacterium]